MLLLLLLLVLLVLLLALLMLLMMLMLLGKCDFPLDLEAVLWQPLADMRQAPPTDFAFLYPS